MIVADCGSGLTDGEVAQVMVIPISAVSSAYAQEVRRTLRKAGFHVIVDMADNKMQKKVREAQLDQYNYILVRSLRPDNNLVTFAVGLLYCQNKYTLCSHPSILSPPQAILRVMSNERQCHQQGWKKGSLAMGQGQNVKV